MRKLWLLVACFACATDARRLKATLDQHFSSEDVGRQKPMKQPSSNSGSRVDAGKSHNAQNIFTPRKFVSILLTFFSPVLMDAPMSHGSASTSSARNLSQMQKLQSFWAPMLLMTGQDSVEDVLPEDSAPTVHVVVTVDWEGLDLRTENSKFFTYFRAAHPEVPLTHFLNAAYFTKGAGQSIQEWNPSDAVSSIDELGLQIYGWKSLVEYSGVQFRSEPDIFQTHEELKRTWEADEEMKGSLEIHFSEWLKRKQPGEELGKTRAEGEALRDLEKIMEHREESLVEWLHDMKSLWNASEVLRWLDYLNRDAGYDTDVRTYSVKQLQAIISKSKEILQREGLQVGKSFRVGWRLAGPNVLEAFQREGFGVNSSAMSLDEMMGRLTPAEKEPWEDAPLVAMTREVWPGIDNTSQPFLVKTPVGHILEMPGVAGPADQNTVKDMVEHIDSAVQRLGSGSGDQFVQIGLTQESAATYGPRVVVAITEIKRKHGHRVVFETLEASARRARSMQKLKTLESNDKPHAKQNSLALRQRIASRSA